jgi:Fur family transcriptional regulator, zinc uptake regulator
MDNALQRARKVCEENKVRLTPIREKVLLLVWQSHNPLGAYDILPMLSENGKVAAPPTVYRALDFLVAQGLVHRIASLNAFVGCSISSDQHVSQFLLCRKCGVAIEIVAPAITKAIAHNADQYGFQIDNESIEISGLCQCCQS